MKEVSCKVLPVFFKGAEKQNRPVDVLCRDLPYDLNYLRNTKNYIEWDAFCRICDNSRAFWNDDDYVQLGKQSIEWRVLPVLSSFLGFFLNSKDMYRLMFSKRGLNSQLFRCISPALNELDENHIELIAEIMEGYRYSREFFLISKGTFIAAPTLLKQSPALVQMTETEKGAIFKISFPHRSNVITRLKQLLSLPSSRRQALRELTETYELLYERYGQLEESRAAIQQQAQQLETALQISQLARNELDLDFLLQSISESLINVAGFIAVEIDVLWNVDDEQIKRNAVAGKISAKAVPIVRPLIAHGYSLGELRIWLLPGSSADNAQHLLNLIIAPITLEIFTAVSFTLLDNYRGKIQRNMDDIRSAIKKEKMTIVSDLHDDIGSDLTKIALLSEQVRRNTADEQSRLNIEKITSSAQEALARMSEIVWTMNYRNDSLENLVVYTRRYAMEYFEQTGIECRVSAPDTIREVIVSGEQRRNVFLSVKEALHNIVKHSCARMVEIKFSVNNSLFEIEIHDNGKGIDLLKLSENGNAGNGLKNMKERMEQAGGSFEIKNHEGTDVRLTMPL